MKPFQLRGHEKPINVVKFNFDGDLFFTGSSDKKINLWAAFSGERLGSYHGSAAIKSVDVNDDSSLMVSASLDGTLEFWEVLSGKLIGSIKKNTKAKYVEFSMGDEFLVVIFESYGTGENEVKIYEVKKILSLFKTAAEVKDSTDISVNNFIIKEKKKLTQISWSFLNKNFIACTDDGFLMMIELDGKITNSVKLHDEINSFSMAPDFSVLLTAGKDGGKLVDPLTFDVIRTFKQEFPMNSSAISPLICDKKDPKFHALIGGGIPARMAAKTKQGGFEIHMLNLMYEEEIGYIPGHFGPVNSLAFFKDGRGFVSGGEEGITRVFRFDKTYYEEKQFK